MMISFKSTVLSALVYFGLARAYSGEGLRHDGSPTTRKLLFAKVHGDGNPSFYYGDVTFEFPTVAIGYTNVTYNFTGLTPGLHGMHVHTGPVGENNNCSASFTLGHWNPGNTNHGSNLDEQRHKGDLGNILADANEAASGWLLAAVQPLVGRKGIVGRSVVVHGGVDDLGLGGNQASRDAGNAGPRIACGTITIKT